MRSRHPRPQPHDDERPLTVRDFVVAFGLALLLLGGAWLIVIAGAALSGGQ